MASARTFVADQRDNQRLANLCGPIDENLRMIAQTLGVQLSRRGHRITVQGENSALALSAVRLFYAQASQPLLAREIQMTLTQLQNDTDAALKASEPGQAKLSLSTRRGPVRGRTDSQRQYINNILNHDITFGVGPAGTGKTYLAVACAVEALKQGQVDRIVLTRPAVEAGERLGFLPGDLSQKVDPYLRPLYDSLYELLGFEHTDKLFTQQVIEVAPLAYMRGRTLSDSFIIFDEAQNATLEQIKMFLTRLGFGSKMVITGDPTQTDLPQKEQSGLKKTLEILRSLPAIACTRFKNDDVLRHPLVASIVQAYARQNS